MTVSVYIFRFDSKNVYPILLKFYTLYYSTITVKNILINHIEIFSN